MTQSFGNVRVLIGSPVPTIRTAVKGALSSHGFRTMTETDSFVRLRDLLEQDAVDLVVTTTVLEERQVGTLIQEVRHHRLGSNPFIIVIMLLATADPGQVRQSIDSGADDLLLLPIAPDQLQSRVDKLAAARKPFVITHDYIGPDRRAKSRPYEKTGPILLVPNPLRARLTDGADSTRLNLQIRAAAQTLNRMKIGRMCAQLEWLLNAICAGLRNGSAADASPLSAHAGKTVATIEEIARRILDTPANAHAGLVAKVLDNARAANHAPNGASLGEFQKLLEQSRVLSRALTTSLAQKANA